MGLRKRDARLIQRMRLQPGINIAGKGEKRGPLGQIAKPPEPLGIQLREARRDMHQLRQPLGREPRRRFGKADRFLREMRVGGGNRRQRAFEIERLGGGKQGNHAAHVGAIRAFVKTASPNRQP